jgi:hypothetical protein
MKKVSVAVITVDNTIKTNILGFRDYVFNMTSSDNLMINS